MSLGRSEYLVLHLPVQPCSGFVVEAASPPIFFLMSITVGFCPFFLQYIFQTPCTLGKILQYSTTFLRVTLFGFSMSPTFSEVPKLSSFVAFGRRLWSCQRICFNSSRTIWLVRPVWYPRGYLILFWVLWPFYCSSGGTYFGILIIQKFSIYLGGFWSSWKECFATARNILGSLLPAPCFSCLIMEMVFAGCFPSLRRDF